MHTPFPACSRISSPKRTSEETCSLGVGLQPFPRRLVLGDELPSKSGLYWSEEPSNGYELSSISAR
jgi:hypothetical protein